MALLIIREISSVGICPTARALEHFHQDLPGGRRVATGFHGHENILCLPVVDHRFQSRDRLLANFRSQRTLVDQDPRAAEFGSVVDPPLGEVDRLQPQHRVRRGDVQNPEPFAVAPFGQRPQGDLVQLRLCFLQPVAKLVEIGALRRQKVAMLRFYIVNAIALREHVGHIHDVQGSLRIVRIRRVLQYCAEVRRHDGNPVTFRLIGTLPPDSAGTASRYHGTNQKLTSSHLSMPHTV